MVSYLEGLMAKNTGDTRAAIAHWERCFELGTPSVDYQKKLEELRRLQEEGRLSGNGPDLRELITRIKNKLPEIQQLGSHLRITRGQRKVEHRLRSLR